MKIAVPDWKNWLRWYSTYPKLAGMLLMAAAASAALAGGAAAVWVHVVGWPVIALAGLVLFAVSLVGRLLQQGFWRKLRHKTDDTDEAGA